MCSDRPMCASHRPRSATACATGKSGWSRSAREGAKRTSILDGFQDKRPGRRTSSAAAPRISFPPASGTRTWLVVASCARKKLLKGSAGPRRCRPKLMCVSDTGASPPAHLRGPSGPFARLVFCVSGRRARRETRSTAPWADPAKSSRNILGLGLPSGMMLIRSLPVKPPANVIGLPIRRHPF